MVGKTSKKIGSLKYGFLLFLCALVFLPVPTAQGQQQKQEFPWPVMLGMRVAAAEANRPVAPVVVLVPDAATYLREIGRWSPNAQWPVLIEDTKFAPMFIRAFKPSRIVRVPSADPLPGDRKKREEAMRSVAARAWGAIGKETSAEVFARIGWQPPGVVITDTGDPAWPAGLALAAARGLPLQFLYGKFGSPNSVLDARRTSAFVLELQSIVSSMGYPWRELGDTIDAVAICKSISGRTSLEPEGLARSPYAEKMKGSYALMDMICRDANGLRWAFGGWIWGNEIRSSYMAMCSIFLQRSNILFFNGYAQSRDRELYSLSEAALQADAVGFKTSVFQGEQGSLRSWLNLNRGGLAVDVLFANSSGRPEFFDLATNTRGHAVDVPILNTPLATQFIHSFSLQRPTSIDTVGGRLLDHGVYAYVGSVEEPYLGAFIPPALYMKRIINFVPFLVAGRMWTGPFSKVWRITSIGDPLMLLQPPPKRVIKAVEFPVPQGAIDVQVEVQELLSNLKEDPSETPASINGLVLIGRDDIAVEVWKTMCGPSQIETATVAAPLALGPLFRTRSFNEFIRAYDRLPRSLRNMEARDMLWHLAMPRLASLNDPNQIMLLASSLRGSDVSVDLSRLMPHLDRVLGPGAGRAAVQRQLDSSANDVYQKKLKQLLQ